MVSAELGSIHSDVGIPSLTAGCPSPPHTMRTPECRETGKTQVYLRVKHRQSVF